LADRVAKTEIDFWLDLGDIHSVLSTTATHALRAMAVLAAGGDRAYLAREISAASGVPGAYLSKILVAMRRAGFIDAVRGRGGGYRLSRPAARIRLVDVVLPFDAVRAKPGCFFEPDAPCSASRPCAAHDRWAEVRRRYVEFLEETTLAEIARGARGRRAAGDRLSAHCFKDGRAARRSSRRR
jgi:Rrf2 family iron-sulfur cluster assembly transcriptional regulator